MTVGVYRQQTLQPDRRSVLRFLRIRAAQADPATEALIDAALAALAQGDYRVCSCELPLSRDEDTLCFGGLWQTRSRALWRHLENCDRAVVFCATLGAAADRMLLASRLSPARAVVFDAAAGAAIEQLCDDFCRTLPQPQRPRFSPGYGDLPLTEQRPLLELLQAQRHLGVTLTDSLLMTPTKSVTAIVGLIGENYGSFGTTEDGFPVL